jgi:antitoxin component HigA of HigAB toxin-antitoxin module
MEVQFVTTPSGDDLAVLPRKDYEALLERLAELEEEDADTALYDARKAGINPVLPAELSTRILKGESLLKAIRNWRHMTQMQVEFKTGIAQSYLSDLESGRRKGTEETLKKLASAYDIPAEWLIAP